MDETYQIYLNRVARATLRETYHSQLEYIQESPKFEPGPAGKRQAISFPGYTVMTPPWEEETANQGLYQAVETCQKQLLGVLPLDLLVPLPPESFHFTLADLIWENAYRAATEQIPDFEQQLRDRIGASFARCQSDVRQEEPVRWQLFGFMVHTRSITLCLVPRNEEAYNRLLQLRRSIYQNSQLIALGIEQQYRFTAHITLGYFGAIPTDLDLQGISAALADLSNQWLDRPAQEFWVSRAELRKFDNMIHFYREADWPTVSFCDR